MNALHAASKVALFVIFIVLCVLIARANSDAMKRKLVLTLAAYFVVIQLILGATQKDMWPFTPYRLMHGLGNMSAEVWRISAFGVDARGREWRVDTHAWEPLPDWNLQFFFMTKYRDFGSADRAVALKHLYGLAERDRAFIAQHGELPSHSPLHSLAAPQLWEFPRETAAPRERYAALRVYREVWTTAAKLVDPRNVSRTMIGEYVPR